MTDAIHFAGEWTDRFQDNRPTVTAISLSDPPTLTYIANSYGFDQNFARQVEAQERPSALLVTLSKSENSPDVHEAVLTAGPTRAPDVRPRRSRRQDHRRG